MSDWKWPRKEFLIYEPSRKTFSQQPKHTRRLRSHTSCRSASQTLHAFRGEVPSSTTFACSTTACRLQERFEAHDNRLSAVFEHFRRNLFDSRLSQVFTECSPDHGWSVVHFKRKRINTRALRSVLGGGCRFLLRAGSRVNMRLPLGRERRRGSGRRFPTFQIPPT
jgi:hypothetical protein